MTSQELEPTDPFVVPVDPSQLAPGTRAHMAFEMRRAGADYELIAEKLGYKSAGGAEQAVRGRVKKLYTPEDVDRVVEMELARLDALQLIAWRRAKNGDLAAIDRILKIMERRSQYLGLDKKQPVSQGPMIQQTAILIGGSETEYIEKLKQAREEALEAYRAGEIEAGT
jgi:hypothetical protein